MDESMKIHKNHRFFNDFGSGDLSWTRFGSRGDGIWSQLEPFGCDAKAAYLRWMSGGARPENPEGSRRVPGGARHRAVAGGPDGFGEVSGPQKRDYGHGERNVDESMKILHKNHRFFNDTFREPRRRNLEPT